MTSEKKKEYTLRISQANPTRLLVILYEMFDDYLEDAINAGKESPGAMHEGIQKASLCINQLMDTLDMEYEISVNLYRIYLHVLKEMSLAEVRNDTKGLTECRKLIKNLRDAYDSISHLDESAPVMENSQAVYAGLTYGRNSLSENSYTDRNRGFLV